MLVCKQSGGKEGQESIGFAVVNVKIIDKVLTNSGRMRRATPTTLLSLERSISIALVSKEIR